MSRRFEIVDVFVDPDAGQPGSGNQLAVVLDAEGLSDTGMQAIAAEFGFAETGFVLPPADPANRARVRIFTPGLELPFAGHPCVGTAAVLGPSAGPGPVLETAAGAVQVADEAGPDRAMIRAPRGLTIGPTVPADTVAALAGLAAADILDVPFAPRIASAGAAFLFAAVTPDALARACPDPAAFAHAVADDGLDMTGLHLHARTDRPDTVEARMFAPGAGVAEDAATGSAAAALAALLHHHHRGPRRLIVRQGRFVGRPSRIETEVRADGIWIGGRVRRFATGVLA